MKRVIFSFVVVAAIAVSAVVVTSCGNAQAQGGGSAQSVKWEYKIEAISVSYDSNNRSYSGVAEFNALGAEGWELFIYDNSAGRAYFKRRLP